jgi:hypothetical protein
MIIYLVGGSQPPQVNDHLPRGGEGRGCCYPPLPGSDVRPPMRFACVLSTWAVGLREVAAERTRTSRAGAVDRAMSGTTPPGSV